MIRDMNIRDIDRVMRIWLAGNLDAHPFIPGEYWQGQFAAVRELLPRAEVIVYEEGGDILAFAGMQEGYLAGIFVDAAQRSRGIGAQLLSEFKRRHARMTLSVYRDNRRAVDFYIRNGFSITHAGMDADTGADELTLAWASGAASG